jgi:hypothetical protein
MTQVPYSDEILQQTAELIQQYGSVAAASRAVGVPESTLRHRSHGAARRGLLGTKPVLPGFRISKTTAVKDEDGNTVREFIQQRPEVGEEFAVPEGHHVKGVSALVDAQGNVVQQWVKTAQDAAAQEAAMRAVVAALKEEIPHAEPVAEPAHGNPDLLNQYTITDVHMGMLAWGEESGEDYDLKIAEQLLLDWFGAAVKMSPDAHTAVLAQLGDLLHHDAHASVTPTHAHVLDADSRLQKIIRVVIRTMRRVISMLLAKHQRVHIIMADANHDPTGGAWLREMFAAFFEDEPRVTVDNSASTYYVVEHGLTSLFYHHGHKRKVGDVDSVFAGQFRDVFGRTKFSYAHIGHLHSDELKSTNLMRVERHETLAARDAYAANGGWITSRSAKVITYHKSFGEVSRITLSPQMVQAA